MVSVKVELGVCHSARVMVEGGLDKRCGHQEAVNIYIAVAKVDPGNGEHRVRLGKVVAAMRKIRNVVGNGNLIARCAPFYSGGFRLLGTILDLPCNLCLRSLPCGDRVSASPSAGGRALSSEGLFAKCRTPQNRT